MQTLNPRSVSCVFNCSIAITKVRLCGSKTLRPPFRMPHSRCISTSRRNDKRITKSLVYCLSSDVRGLAYQYTVHGAHKKVAQRRNSVG